MAEETWCVWMLVPATEGWSRVVTDLTQVEAEKFAANCIHKARAMPERGKA